MSTLPLFLTFLAAISVLTITPGVDTALVLRTAAANGARAAFRAALGVALGCLVWGAAVALGLEGLLTASELGYDLVKFIGAGYLLWLGGKLLLNPRSAFEIEGTAAQQPRKAAAFRRGLLTNILNPKVGMFYITFLPQFVPTSASVGPYTFMLAAVHVVLTLLWFAILIAATVPLGRWLRTPAIITWLDRLTGSVFIAFGAKLALSPRH